ncbi:lysozyme inhibitor LprI family protein [Paraburkholderia sp.]|jgi:uncharacterized protein YecT (DUF1311 family)|uniref:lysozyme inhibitor LprI family protein n=1 Tax=Paraburkholderia sp. TaxID=1926495 RepID=UPI002F3F5A34
MLTIRRICFGVSVCWPAIVLAASTAPTTGEQALRNECSAFSQAGIRDCLEEKVENSQKVLSQAEQKMVGTLSKWDEDNRYIRQANAKLVASNKKFAEYRATQCEFSASLSGGAAGDAREIRRLACVAELNNRRAEQLANAASELPLK